jgi:hypothetical protein
MTVIELLERIRRPYIDTLSRAAALDRFHVEPMLRNGDGTPARDGTLATPYRCDLARRDTGATQTVDAAARIRLDDVSVDMQGATLTIAGFSWDWLTLDVAGLPEHDAAPLVRDWFLRWIDEDDDNARNADGLYGVVHFIDDPVAVDDALRFRIDLGSAPAAALSELIELLLDRGAVDVALH